MASRSWVFTLNNYTDPDLLVCNSLPARYTIYGKEIGESGTPHLQGYIELAKPQRLSAMTKMIPRAHFEKRLGTREQARDYCKKDGQFTEIGDWEAGGQGTRNDLKDVMKKIREKKPLLEIMEDHPTTCANNLRFIDRYTALIEKEETKTFRNITTEVIIGDAGIGKTKSVWEREPDVFTVNPEDAFPFDGYTGEEAILIDDFEGQLKYKHLLKILDGYQLRVNVKGSHRYAQWKRVYITTNEEPTTWYQRGLTPALKRRLTTVTKLGNEETGNSMPSPLSALN